MSTRTPLMAQQIVDCIASGREPTDAEEAAVAARIWAEVGRDRTMRMWSQLAPAAWDRLMAVRAASAALRGARALA